MLETLNHERVLSLFEEKRILFPEISAGASELADRFGFEYKGTPDNLGIFGGFKALAETFRSRYLLLLENDLQLIESADETARQIQAGVNLLKEQKVQVVQSRHNGEPGEPHSGFPKYRKYHPADDADTATRLAASARRFLRPQKAHRLKGSCSFGAEDEWRRFAEISKDETTGFLLMGPEIRNWTNLAVLIKRDFFLDVLLRRVASHPSKRRVNGFRNIEIELNDAWWRELDLTIGVAPGLFTHRRMEYRGY